MTPGAYNNHVQIAQAPGYVTLVVEMVHDARVIPVDGRPRLPARIPQYKGDSRGRWEGRTLVIDTTNFLRETSFRGSSANMHLVERLTRVDADTLLYEFTVEDPKTWTKPWTAAIPMKKVDTPIYEYACHEGNYALPNILRGARLQESKGASTMMRRFALFRGDRRERGGALGPGPCHEDAQHLRRRRGRRQRHVGGLADR